LPRPAGETAPVDSNIDRWRRSVGVPTSRILAGGSFCGQPLGFVVDIAIGRIAILVAQRQRPQRHRRAQATLRGDAAARAFGRRKDEIAAVGSPDRVTFGVEQPVV